MKTITKSLIEHTNSYLAQARIAAVIGMEDDRENHITDTLRAGRIQNSEQGSS